MRRKTNGQRRQKVLEMAEICGKVGISGKAANVLANRWFQPLTHVSDARTPREPGTRGQEGKREKREISGSSWHSPRHNTFPRRSAKQLAPDHRQVTEGLTTTRGSRAMDLNTIPKSRHNEQQHYTDLEFHRQFRDDLLADKDNEVCALGFLLYAEELGLPHRLPVPPRGLPGHNRDYDPAVMEMIREGVRYALAIAKGEKKTLWNIHDRFKEILRAEYWRGKEAERHEVETSIARTARQRVFDERKEEDRPSFVYFIQSAAGGIKIGLARDVKARMQTLQTAHPVKLTLLATTSGKQPDEFAYHQRFAEHRLHGEWFSPAPEILAEIERLQL